MVEVRNKMRAELAARAAGMLGVPPARALALMLTYEEAMKGYSEEDRRKAAQTVLFWKEDGRLNIGYFESKLMSAWDAADEVNRDRLAIAFPIIADAMDVYRLLGSEGVKSWVEGTFTDNVAVTLG